jgi:pSer/pThr/pTyr-binding forkhead associated (FHA) protein
MGQQGSPSSRSQTATRTALVFSGRLLLISGGGKNLTPLVNHLRREAGIVHGMADKGLSPISNPRLFSWQHGKADTWGHCVPALAKNGEENMSSSLDHKCQRCGSEYHGQICPFCTITGLDVNALLASEGLSMPATASSGDTTPADVPADAAAPGEVVLIDVVSNRTYPINSPVSRFGRDISNDVVLTGDKSLSRFHFQVTIVNSEYFVEDAGSRNGTFLNGAPVTAPKKLLNGDIISAGMSRYRLVVGGEEMPPNPAGDAVIAQAEKERAEQAAAEGAAAADAVVDPLKRIMEEGMALLGEEEGEGSVADVQDFLNGKTESNGGGEPPKYLDLGNKKETPIDDLFQEKLRENEAAAAAMEASAPVPPPPPASAIPPVPEARKPAASQGNWPKWCTNYTFPEITEIKNKMTQLEQEIRERQEQLAELQTTVANTEDVRNRVLATNGRDLVQACEEVLKLLGWECAMNGASDNELVLSSDGTAVAIAKIVSTDKQPRPQDMANLVSSLSTYWCDNGVEPKGVLVVSMANDGLPEEREKFSKDIVDYATKKNICLISTVQLLAMYRDVSLRDHKVESIRSEVLAANGALSGFEPVTSTKE